MALTRLAVDDNIAVLYIDHPPVNSGNATQRADLLQALTEAGSLPGLKGVVVISAGKHFYAGSDLNEFDTGIQQPQLPEVIQTVEALRVPVVAAINGAALGGGLEFALACDARVATPDARLGFPETSLGIIPGAGGTVRATLLLGFRRAAELVATAQTLAAEEAHRIGLVDRLCTSKEGLLAAAMETVRSLAGRKDRLVDRPWPEASDEDVFAIRQGLPSRVRPNVLAAMELMAEAQRRGNVADALAAERHLFLRLVGSQEAQNLRYLFFAKKAAAQDFRSAARPRLRRVGIAGAGTMGLALAKVIAATGLDLTVYDPKPDARTRVARTVPEATVVADLSGFSEADLLIDAVFEDLTVKRELFAAVEPYLSDNCVLASNTSYLDLDALAEPLNRPERLVGLHFFNPPGRNPLVEVISASKTNAHAVGAAVQLAQRLGKTVIPAGPGDGFVANRVYADYRSQAEFLVEEGATPRDVDQAMESLGLPIGPFAVSDMSGLDIAWARRTRLAPTRPPGRRYVRIPDLLCEAGRLGKKTGRGWYDYPDGYRRGTDSPEVAELIRQARLEAGRGARTFSEQEIQARVIGAMVCAASSLVEAGIATRSSDIDVAFTEGFAFPKWLGGPLRYAASQPESWVVTALAETYRSCPETYRVAHPAQRGEMPSNIDALLRGVRQSARHEEAALD